MFTIDAVILYGLFAVAVCNLVVAASMYLVAVQVNQTMVRLRVMDNEMEQYFSQFDVETASLVNDDRNKGAAASTMAVLHSDAENQRPAIEIARRSSTPRGKALNPMETSSNCLDWNSFRPLVFECSCDSRDGSFLPLQSCRSETYTQPLSSLLPPSDCETTYYIHRSIFSCASKLIGPSFCISL
jgi:hypothetical protein